jgi:two-component system chemotaxis response regulator CheB
VLPDTGHPDVVVIGASAGGVNALVDVVSGLPPDLAAAICVVLHIPRHAPSALAAILARNSPLSVGTATDGEQLRLGHIHVAATDHHLLVMDGRLRLSRGPTENGHRPAIDPLFRSAARAYGSRVIGVVLSGSRDDGSSGLATIAARGGYTVVQEPADALHPSMPRAALALVQADQVVPAAKIGPVLAGLVGGALRPARVASADDEATLDAQVAVSNLEPVPDLLRRAPAGFGCPDCGGAMFTVGHQDPPLLRCRVGHAWSADGLLQSLSEQLQRTLWRGLRVLEEKAALAERMAAARQHRGESGDAYQETAGEAERAAQLLRGLIATVSDLRAVDSG